MVVWILIKIEDHIRKDFFFFARLTLTCHRANSREDPKTIAEDEGETSAVLLKRFVDAAT